MTTFAKKFPVAVGILFFSVASASAMLSGAEILTALFRGMIAAAVSVVFAALFGYLLFSEKIPEAAVPEELAKLKEKAAQPK